MKWRHDIVKNQKTYTLNFKETLINKEKLLNGLWIMLLSLLILKSLNLTIGTKNTKVDFRKSRCYSMQRTINSILGYTLTEQQKKALYDAGIVNGIWWQGENIETPLLAIIELLPWYNNNKAQSLIADIRELSVVHDIEYVFKLWFYRSNYRFAKHLYQLLHWSNWKRFAVALTAFILLNRHWKEFYNQK